MTTLAPLAELAAVHVIPAVTAEARGLELDVGGTIHGLAMAGAAR